LGRPSHSLSRYRVTTISINETIEEGLNNGVGRWLEPRLVLNLGRQSVEGVDTWFHHLTPTSIDQSGGESVETLTIKSRQLNSFGSHVGVPLG
jgi:hypothetical protein